MSIRDDFSITELIERVREGHSPATVIEEIMEREADAERKTIRKEKRRERQKQERSDR